MQAKTQILEPRLNLPPLRWLAESAKAPQHWQTVDDTLSVNTAHQLASAGYGMIWQGDYHNAKALVQALARRIDKQAQKKHAKLTSNAPTKRTAQDFHNHRMAQAQRARILNSIIVVMSAAHELNLRRAPDVRAACHEVFGAQAQAYVLPLRQLLATIAAYEWRKKGVHIPALDATIHPHYGVFSPIRGEYLDLIAKAPLPPDCRTAWDIGTGSGVIAALLAKRGVAQVIAIDNAERALACAAENIERLGLGQRVTLSHGDMFTFDNAPSPTPHATADLIVCNPPWLPAKPSAPIEYAIYDEKSQMLTAYLQGVAQHLSPHGQAWLVMSDLAEHLGLRDPRLIPDLIQANGLTLHHKYDTRPTHSKVFDHTNPLHDARRLEVTSLWCLALRQT